MMPFDEDTAVTGTALSGPVNPAALVGKNKGFYEWSRTRLNPSLFPGVSASDAAQMLSLEHELKKATEKAQTENLLSPEETNEYLDAELKRAMGIMESPMPTFDRGEYDRLGGALTAPRPQPKQVGFNDVNPALRNFGIAHAVGRLLGGSSLESAARSALLPIELEQQRANLQHIIDSEADAGVRGKAKMDLDLLLSDHENALAADRARRADAREIIRAILQQQGILKQAEAGITKEKIKADARSKSDLLRIVQSGATERYKEAAEELNRQGYDFNPNIAPTAEEALARAREYEIRTMGPLRAEKVNAEILKTLAETAWMGPKIQAQLALWEASRGNYHSMIEDRRFDQSQTQREYVTDVQKDAFDSILKLRKPIETEATIVDKEVAQLEAAIAKAVAGLAKLQPPGFDVAAAQAALANARKKQKQLDSKLKSIDASLDKLSGMEIQPMRIGGDIKIQGPIRP